MTFLTPIVSVRSPTHGNAMLRVLLVSATLALGACTTVGVHTSAQESVDFGPPATLRVCILRDVDVTPERVDELIASVNQEFAPYGITVVVPWMRDWSRPGFSADVIFQEIVTHPLEPPCDRIVGMVSRDARDFVASIFTNEILGQVDLATHTHGWVSATYASLNQLVLTPSSVVEHEFYHLLGCPHDWTLTKCYPRIADIKREARQTDDFFPGVTLSGEYLTTRAAVNDAFRDGQKVVIDFAPGGIQTSTPSTGPYLSFTDRAIGASSTPQQVVLRNRFSGPLKLRSIVIEGADAAEFSESNDCGSSIRARHTCTINVVFHPTAAGPKTANVSVSVDIGSQVVATRLSGQGI